MLVNGKHYKTIWIDKGGKIKTIDQNLLPFKFKILTLDSSEDVITAIKNMTVRGAPVIGVAGAYGIYLAIKEGIIKGYRGKELDSYTIKVSKKILSTRPTAINLKYSVERTLEAYYFTELPEQKLLNVLNTANQLLKTEEEASYKIGINGLRIIKNLFNKKKHKELNILTHCNAGWLACIDYGTALAPIYLAKTEGIKMHIWIEETRPRNQGARLTAWELLHNGIKHTIITDNAGGYVMQKGLVDMVIVGSDRTTINGDVCNKIGTYKTALAAFDNKIPFYVALPISSFDLKINNALKEIPIEERNSDEVKFIEGYNKGINKVLITPQKSKAKNFGFDITPARLVTALITDKGIIRPDKKQIEKILL
ncbi:MAG: S-methyl-5-thioribose-1-phosphate isomerase [Ignavibacteria bacterium]|nr:S-methyl-5-thioribose-1-phosphate isomerase [Ignavibacteria bacterium]